MSKNIQVNDNFCDHCRKDMPTDDLEVLRGSPTTGGSSNPTESAL
jgi:hypothetical protein